jgi:threonine/homoserine/homoserine lactone efflux protein
VHALVEGILAGLGIAIPVGPIAVLLVDLSMRRGFAHAVPAALGTASADLVYATVAAVLGAAAADALEPFAEPLRILSVVVLLAIAALRTWRLLRPASSEPVDPAAERRAARGGARTYVAFLGLTLMNPATVAYFVALILGLRVDLLAGAAARTLFVVGAFAASASWQLALVAGGGLAHRRLPANATLVTGLLGNAVIVLLAIRLAIAG